MKNNFGFSLGVGAVLAAVLAGARAAEPPRQPAPGADPGLHKGRVLVLDNERTLTGEIERVDDQYRIKRLVGETWVPAGKVLKLCASLEEAHGFLASRTNLHDPDERLRLAEWCRQHGLRELALEEAQEALRLRPGDDRAKRLVGYLQEAKARAASPAQPPAPEKQLPHVDVTAESLGVFASRVQPILMNACANCHTGRRGGSFQLTRTWSSTLGNRRSLEQNLSVVLAQVNLRDPRVSRLLTKAVSIHGPGMTVAPLRGRQAPAYRTLERWVLETLAANPQLRESLPPASASASALPAAKPAVEAGATRWGGDRAAEPVKAPDAPTAPAQAANDPVDPDAFNREFHPPRPAPADQRNESK
jgi:hypothetical protein